MRFSGGGSCGTSTLSVDDSFRSNAANNKSASDSVANVTLSVGKTKLIVKKITTLSRNVKIASETGVETLFFGINKKQTVKSYIR